MQLTKVIDEFGTRVASANRNDDVDEIELHHGKTLPEALFRHAKTHGDRPFLGCRPAPNSQYVFFNYAEGVKRIQAIGSGIMTKFNITPGTKVNLGICAKNCVEWLMVHYALQMYGLTLVPVYDTFGAEAAKHIIKKANLEIFFCFDAEGLTKLVPKFEDCDVVKDIVLLQQGVDIDACNAKINGNYNLTALQQLEELGSKNLLPVQPFDEEAVYAINFTSGTTSLPKGVIITQRMIVNCICGANAHDPAGGMRKTDVYCSFLPLSHMLEQMATSGIVYEAGSVGFFQGNLKNFMDDIATLQPTIICLVPRLLARIHEKAMSKLGKNALLKLIFRKAIQSKLRTLQKGNLEHKTFWDKTLFRNLRTLFGSRLRFMVCGSSSCPTKLLNFGRCVFGCNFVYGYGMTEVAGGIILSHTNDFTPDQVGPPICVAKVRLMDAPDLGLHVKQDQRGEICVKGLICTPGYYKDDEKTAELIDADGWLHTGDVGEWSENGCLRIVDRCKNIFKLSQGEYLAPQKIEDIYMALPIISQIYVDGLGEYSYPIAIVCMELENATSWLQEKEMPAADLPKDMKALCGSQEVKRLLLEEINTFGRKCGLNGFEIVKNLLLIEEPFSVANGLLTPTMKIARHKVKKLYLPQIRQLYEETTTKS